MTGHDTFTLAETVGQAIDALEKWNGPDGSLVIATVARNLRAALAEATPEPSTPQDLAKAERRGATGVLSLLDGELESAQEILRMLAVQHARCYDVLGVARIEGRRASHQLTRNRIARLLAEEATRG